MVSYSEGFASRMKEYFEDKELRDNFQKAMDMLTEVDSEGNPVDSPGKEKLYKYEYRPDKE